MDGEHVALLTIGAGLYGIGKAFHLARSCRESSHRLTKGFVIKRQRGFRSTLNVDNTTEYLWHDLTQPLVFMHSIAQAESTAQYRTSDS